MIEARWLFDVAMDRVQVVVHPQSIIHSMVEFVDGVILAQLSTPDMCLPIQYALTYPQRLPSDRVQTNLAKLGQLSFEEPDEDRFPSLGLARRAGTEGGTLPPFSTLPTRSPSKPSAMEKSDLTKSAKSSSALWNVISEFPIQRSMKYWLRTIGHGPGH